MKPTLTYHHRPDDLVALELFLTHMVQEFMHFLQGTGLSGPQVHALLHIHHAGECRVSEIGALAGSSNAAASQLVERLVRQGLVERTEDPKNRRVKRLRLTQRGHEIIRNSMLENHLLKDFMSALTPTQRAAVHAAITRVVGSDRKAHLTHIQKAGQHA
jgi:DNA-binding MarR family transcriptional regulator